MTGERSGWQPVAALADVVRAGLLDVICDGQPVLLVHLAGAVHAVQGLCPHQFARLAHGRLDGDGWLECPHHRARFRLADGRCGPGWQLPALRRYPVRVDGDAVHLPDPLRALD